MTFIWTSIAALTGALGMLWTSCGTLKGICALDILICVGHSIFAYYIQNQIFKQMGGGSGAEVVKTAGKIVLYDIGFCIYVICFIIAFVVQLFGISQLGGCTNSGMPLITYFLLIFYCFAVVGYVSFWYCCACSGMASYKSQAQPGGPAPQQMGASA